MDEQVSARVAWLYYMEGLTQAEIAERLGLTRVRVNRLLAECRSSGLVRITLNAPIESCVALEQALRQRCKLKDAVIIPTPQDLEQVAGLLGIAAGEYLSRFLDDNRLSALGVGWGATLRETIRHVRKADYPELWVTSMMGGLTQGLEINTFEIATDLAKRLNARCSYLAAPIYAGSPRSRDTIVAQDVFKEVLERIAGVDLAFVSLGDLTRRSLLIRNGLPRDVSVDELRAAGAVGDVLGQFIDAAGKPIDHPINKRVIGLSVEGLSRIGTVVVAAGGANKARIIAAALAGELIDVLISDEQTAAAALDIVANRG